MEKTRDELFAHAVHALMDHFSREDFLLFQEHLDTDDSNTFWEKVTESAAEIAPERFGESPVGGCALWRKVPVVRDEVRGDVNFEDCPLNDLRCSVCDERQRDIPGGSVCVNGHGGVDGYRDYTVSELDGYDERDILAVMRERGWECVSRATCIPRTAGVPRPEMRTIRFTFTRTKVAP